MSDTCFQTNVYVLRSSFLQREVTVSLLSPPQYQDDRTYPLILFNDGQDFEALKIHEILNREHASGRIPPVFVAGIHANERRLSEYGVAAQPDYAGRGDRAGATTFFVLKELLPELVSRYPVSVGRLTYAGFSLGGLMALDAVWNHPEVFARAGVFSGSLWWRSRALDEGYNAQDRIMHAQIRNSVAPPELKFWFQCGTRDETDDRDHDGVIDSIQDTLECISALEHQGYVWGKDIVYHEVREGIHAPSTWSEVLPDFLRWALSGL